MQPLDPVEREALRSKYRSMAILTLILGLALVVLAFMMVAMARIAGPLLSRPGLPPLPYRELMPSLLRFSERSGWVMAPLGVLLASAGWKSLTRPPRIGRVALHRAAWLLTGAMVVLAGIWELEAFQSHFTFGYHFMGLCSHLGQGVLCYLAARFLASPPLLTALEEPTSAASSAGASS